MKHTIAVLLILFSAIAHAAQDDNKENEPPMPSAFVRTQEDIDAVRAYLDWQFAHDHPQSEWFTSRRETQEQPPLRSHRDNPDENSER